MLLKIYLKFYTWKNQLMFRDIRMWYLYTWIKKKKLKMAVLNPQNPDKKRKWFIQKIMYMLHYLF